MSTARVKLQTGFQELTAARAELAAGRETLLGMRAEMATARGQLTELKAAVPGAFDAALASYLSEIDARGARIETTFQSGLDAGFRDRYLLFAGALRAHLLALLAVGKPRHRRSSAHPGEDVDTLAAEDAQPEPDAPSGEATMLGPREEVE